MNSEEKARTFNMDGYYNMLNKYGTRQDNQTAYDYLSDPFVDDMTLVKMYEGNGLFSTVIDRPAEEATKHGFDIDFGKEEISDYIYERMDDIGFEEQFTTAIKWARLYGGAIGVLIVNDGKGLEEPLDVNGVTSIEEIRVFERSLVQPDYQTMYSPANGIRPNTVYREPEFFDVFSIYGTFKVHRSRCLVFRNGRLPEQATNENYRYWGIPEYIRVREAIRECVTSHRYGVQLLEKSSQAVYSMKNLANYLSTDAGENQIIKRLQIIDMARSMMNTIAIDADGEMYDFKTMTMAGAKDLIDTTCNMLSAVTHIPQTILFGRSPAGENATGESDMENYYNMVENIQKQNMKRNSRLVIDLIINQGIHDGDIEKAPKYRVSFAKLWSMSDSEQASVEQTKAQTELTKAQAVQIYSDLQAVDPTEIRESISDNEDLGISVDKSADSQKKNLESIDIDPDDLDLGTAIDIQDESEEKEEVSNNQNPEKDNRHAEEKEIAEGVDHEEDIKPTDSEMVIGEETEDAPDTVPSESETVIAKEMNNDAAEGDWITINGTNVLIGKGGKAESGGNLVGKDFSSAKSEKHEAKGKSGGGNKAAKTEPAKTSKESPSSKSITTKRDYSGVPSDIAEAANKGEFMVYGGDAEKVREERKQKIIDSGLKYTTNEEYGSVVVNDPRLSFEENSNLSKIANNGWSDLNVDDYRKACKEAGVEPDLHYTAKEYPQQSLKKADGTPVYWNLRPNMVMSAEQIYQHGESAQKILDNSHKVTEQMTDAQRASVTNYTGQYSDRGYLAVNGYLSGENPNASAQTKESAKHLTEALDHELGADTTVFRGEDDMSHISSNPKASKILKQISRGDFSHAAELKEILEGSEVENSTVVSTSPYYNSNYGMRDIQMVMKVPGSAKAVNITELSKYGGSKDKFSQMFGSSMNQESEIAFKPGMKYKITDVEYGLDTTEKKPKGKVFLTCEVIPEGKDNPEPRKKANGSNSAAKSNNTQLVKHETSASESKSVSLQKPYSTGYADTWTDPDDPSYTVDLTESKDIWLEGNKDQLVKNWKERRAQGIKEKPKDFENHEYTAWQLSKISGHEKELPLDDAMDKMNDAMPANVFHGWFTEANSEYKPRVVEAVTKSPEARSAALSIMFENYKYFHPNTKMTFNEFLNSPMTMYRGGHGQSHTEDDVFSSYTWDKSVAEKFAGKGGKVYEAHIRPIDTYGSVNDAGESEIMVPSVIAPNGNKDSRTDADTDNGVGIIVVKDGKFLVGTRQDGFGICSAGGHIKDGETPQEAAKREAYEEFGIAPLTLIPIGETKASSGLYCNSTVFLCDSYSGKIDTDEEEMTSPRFMTMDELCGVRLYEPFKESLALMLDVLFGESKRIDASDGGWITVN